MTGLAEWLLEAIADEQAAATAEVERLRGAPRRGGKTTAARNRAGVAAKRRLVKLHSEWHVCVNADGDGAQDYGDTDAGLEQCPTLLLVAAPYSGRPGFREEWRV